MTDTSVVPIELSGSVETDAMGMQVEITFTKRRVFAVAMNFERQTEEYVYRSVTRQGHAVRIEIEEVNCGKVLGVVVEDSQTLVITEGAEGLPPGTALPLKTLSGQVAIKAGI